MADIQSSDITKETSGIGNNQFYVIDRKTVTISSADYTGLNSYKEEVIIKAPYDTGAIAPPYRIEVTHQFTEFQADFFPTDSAVYLPLPHSFEGASASYLAWAKYFAGAPGSLIYTLSIYYTADATSGTVLSKDIPQTFLVTIYSQTW